MKVSWEDFNKRKKEDTIEHIYPQSPNDIYWKNRFGHLKPSEKRQYLNSLGNLLLLNRSKIQSCRITILTKEMSAKQRRKRNRIL